MDWLPTIMGIVLAVTGVFVAIYLIVAVLFIILEHYCPLKMDD